MENNNQVKNLEYEINNVAFEIVSENILDETEINKLLGVLANDGVYAMWVYALDKLDWKYDIDSQKMIKQELFKFLEKISRLAEYLEKDDLKLNMGSLIYELTKNTEEINKLNNDMNQLEKEIKKLKNNRKREKEKTLKQKQEELSKKIEKRNRKLNEFFINLSKDINDLLFFKEILEKTLIYARYHAKALGD